MQLLKNKRFLVAISLVLLAATILSVIVFKNEIADWELNQARLDVLEYLKSIPPYLYFLAFAILPAVGAPLSFFYLTALPVLSPHNPVLGLLAAYAALAINITLSGILCRTILRPMVERIISKRNMTIPSIEPETEWQVTLAIRLSPIPFPIQNYLLALGQSRWRFFLGLSLAVQGTIGTLVMLVGDSIFKGGFGYAIFGGFLIILLSLILKRFRHKLIQNSSSSNASIK